MSLTRDDREHYIYQCHACAAQEYEILLLVRSDPDHPDAAWLASIPVDLGLARDRS